MRKNRIFWGVLPALTLFSAQTMALPFSSIDPRSFSMGGTGVASGTSANAGFMNPALLAAANRDEDFSMEVPIVGGRFMDPDDLLDEIDAYQGNNLEGQFDTALADFKATPSPATATPLKNASQALIDQMTAFSDKPLQGEGLAGFVIGIPSKSFGMSLTSNVWVIAGGSIQNIAADLADFQAIVDAINANNLVPGDPAYDVIVNGPSRTLQSTLSIRGAILGEVGLSIAREMDIAGHKVAMGITPKYVGITTFDADLSLDTAEFSTANNQREYSNFNVDFGMAKNYHNGWKTGFVVKNLIAQEYVTALGNVIEVKPQPRIGISHGTEWTTVAVDLDLVENDPAGAESPSQNVGIGAELDIFDTFQLRVGYRHNLSDTDTSVATAGIGFSPFGVHADVGVAANENEIGISFQLGLRF